MAPPFSKLYSTVITGGGVAGDHRVPTYGMRTEDKLVSVHHIDDEDLGTNDDLTSEFTVAGPNLIDNVGGTDTTGGFLVITWLRMRG